MPWRRWLRSSAPPPALAMTLALLVDLLDRAKEHLGHIVVLKGTKGGTLTRDLRGNVGATWVYRDCT